MTSIQFSPYSFQRSSINGKEYIFDIIRKKKIVLTPEEWVRQHILHYLIFDKQISRARIAVERKLSLIDMNKRFDIVVFNKETGKPLLLVECKSAVEKLNIDTFLQATAYNLKLQACYIWLSNGNENLIYDLQHQQILEIFPLSVV